MWRSLNTGYGVTGWAGDLVFSFKRGCVWGSNAYKKFLESSKGMIAAECIFWKTMPAGDSGGKSNSRTIRAIILNKNINLKILI